MRSEDLEKTLLAGPMQQGAGEDGARARSAVLLGADLLHAVLAYTGHVAAARMAVRRPACALDMCGGPDLFISC